MLGAVLAIGAVGNRQKAATEAQAPDAKEHATFPLRVFMITISDHLFSLNIIKSRNGIIFLSIL